MKPALVAALNLETVLCMGVRGGLIFVDEGAAP
jgi:hypothetical protein